MTETGLPARRSAIYLLDQIIGERRLMSECLAAGALDQLPPDDRARAQRLALDTLRSLERLDRLLQKHLRKNPPLSVRNALRIGALELCHGGAAHGVVNAFVQIVGGHRKYGQMKGLTNAVLRKIATDGAEKYASLRIPRLPKWLRSPLVQVWGPDAVADMERAHYAGAPLDITVKPSGEADSTAPDARKLPTGTLRRDVAGQVSTLPGYDAGHWWVQDAAAAIPVQVANPSPGENVLDLCAAPGGKTLQLAAAGAHVRAVDVSAQRMARMHANLERTALTAELVVGDALKQTGVFDAVLLDAPCSATGTIRRHPDLPYAKDGSDFGDLIALQARLLAHAWTLVRPGGRLVYCTCSLLPDEGEVQVEDALAAFSDMQIDRDALTLPGVDPAWVTVEGGLRLRPDYWPNLGGMDGFYIACLRKSG